MFILNLFLGLFCVYGILALYFRVTERFGIPNTIVEMFDPVREIIGGWILGVTLYMERGTLACPGR